MVILTAEGRQVKTVKAMRVTVYRANGRLVKTRTARSRYAAKVLRRQWENKYDETYTVEIEEVGRGG